MDFEIYSVYGNFVALRWDMKSGGINASSIITGAVT